MNSNKKNSAATATQVNSGPMPEVWVWRLAYRRLRLATEHLEQAAVAAGLTTSIEAARDAVSGADAYLDGALAALGKVAPNWFYIPSEDETELDCVVDPEAN